MFRVRTTMLIKYGHYRDVLESSKKLDELARRRGWTPSTFWVGYTGRDNTFVIETDFESLEAYQRESDATSRDSEWMELIRSSAQYVVEGSSETQILASAEEIA